MDFFVNFIGNILDYLSSLAANISETFTGADSGAMLVMIIFYLTSILLIILISWLITKCIKLFFSSLFPRRKKTMHRTAGQSKSTVISETDDAINACPQPSDFAFFESFNGENFLNLLSLKLDTAKNKGVEINEQTLDGPSALDEDHIPEPINLTPAEKEKISVAFKDKDLSSLRELLAREEQRKSELFIKIDSLSNQLSANYSIRARYASEESAAAANYNTSLAEALQLRDECETAKGQLSREHSKLFSIISDIIIRRAEILKDYQKTVADMHAIPQAIQDFDFLCSKSLLATQEDLQRKVASLNAFDEGYSSAKELREKADSEISALRQELIFLSKENLIHAETASLLRIKIEALEKAEAEEIARLNAAQAAREEAERLAQEQERQLKLEQEQAALAAAQQEDENVASPADKPTDESLDGAIPSTDIDAAKDCVDQQAKEAYVLNYEGITPEMLEKIAAVRRNKPTPKTSNSDPINGHGNKGREGDMSVHPEPDKQKSAESPGGPDPRDAGNSETTNPNVDHFGELQKQWAAERAHREQWQAEQAQRQADTERRKKELLESLDSESNSSGS